MNTGEVVAGDPGGQTLVTGDAVNTAAAAGAGRRPARSCSAETTYRLVRDAVEVEPVGRSS